ncbi:outer envelope pore protein 16-2, chloroplastic-like [Dorcoceras hygrometricum]|uniref:Outer envelope pore protein 16-2, chloroplastic-like n=1 Tax=Dorcoceras hygrometricum TaxID=472368 RepID=A0A2Z7ADY1_9LAMI|nr:outer envelope pore protein 16-2, chloroplastic-like [Dorcoceras hygrometricum]
MHSSIESLKASTREASSILATLCSIESLKASSKLLGLEQYRCVKDAYLAVVESVNGDSTIGNTEIGAPKRNQRFPDLRGESNRKSVEALVKNTDIEFLQWGLAARIYSGVTYGLKEASGVRLEKQFD